MLASITGAIGYLLLFAGVAERGKYALRPWDALSAPLNDSVGAGSGGSSSSSGGGGGVVSTVTGILSKIPAIPGLP